MAEEAEVAASVEPISATPASDAGQSQELEQATSAQDADVSQPSQTPQKKAKADTGSKPVNLFELPEFKEYQAAQTRQIERQRQEALRAQQELEAIKLKGMNEYDQLKYKAEKAEQEKTALAEQLELQKYEAQIRQDLEYLTQESGIPIEELRKAQNYDEAQKMSMRYLKQTLEDQVQTKVDAALEAQKANAPDLGGGKTRSPLSPAEEAIQNARDTRNATAYVAALLSNRE